MVTMVVRVVVLVSSLARLVVMVGGEVVRTVYEDDPVLRAVLDQEGAGWRPLDLEVECQHQDRRLSDFCHRQIENYQGCVHSQAGRQSLQYLNFNQQ